MLNRPGSARRAASSSSGPGRTGAFVGAMGRRRHRPWRGRNGRVVTLRHPMEEVPHDQIRRDASAVLHLASAGVEVVPRPPRAPRADAPSLADAVGTSRGGPEGRGPGRHRARAPRPHRADAHQAPRRRGAPASGLGRRGSDGVGLDLHRRVRGTDSAAGRCVRDPGRRAGVQCPAGSSPPRRSTRCARKRVRQSDGQSPRCRRRVLQVEGPGRAITWYREVLGLEVEDWGGVFITPEAMAAHPGAGTVFSLFRADTTYFAPSTRDFMMKFAVDDLDGIGEVHVARSGGERPPGPTERPLR